MKIKMLMFMTMVLLLLSGCAIEPNLTHGSSTKHESLNGNRVDLFTLFRSDNRIVNIHNSKGVEL